MKVYIVETCSWIDYEGSASSIVFASIDKEAAIAKYTSYVGVTYGNADGASVYLYEMEGEEKTALLNWSSNDEEDNQEVFDTDDYLNTLEEYPF